ncbi:hypothetical protein OIV83_000769 [Microbotryomycetes sp. JL201]|nr:hypothetical protein OIV83_000769 [Microbotryomycetes sp. JL201]
MSELLHLDVSRLLVGHATLSLLAALSSSPTWNLPLALYGLVIVTREMNDGGESMRLFTTLFGASFLLDFLWLLQYGTGTLAWLLIVANFLLKPISLISALGHLREQGHATFNLPSSLPGGLPGGFPPRSGETLWSASQQQGGYQQAPQDDFEAPRAPPSRAQQQQQQPQPPRSSVPPAQPAAPARAEGSGYHTLE